MNLTVLLADDHHVVLKTLISFFSKEKMSVLSLAGDGEEAIAQYKEYQPNIAVLDLEMPKKGGLLAAREILRFDTSAQIIIHSAHLHSVYINVLKNLGVLAFVQKGKMKELHKAIECVRQKKRYYCIESAQYILQCGENPDVFNKLTFNEKIIALLLLCSMTLEDISKALNMGLGTVRTHRNNLFRKLKIHSTKELCAFAKKQGL